MPYEINSEARLSSNSDSGGSQELSLGSIAGSFEKFYASGAIDVPAATKITLWDVADDMSVPVDFAVAIVMNRSTTRSMWVFRYADPGGNEVSWAEEVPAGAYTTIWGPTLDSMFAGEVASITGQDTANAVVAKLEVYNPSGGIGQPELILYAEQL